MKSALLLLVIAVTVNLAWGPAPAKVQILAGLTALVAATLYIRRVEEM